MLDKSVIRDAVISHGRKTTVVYSDIEGVLDQEAGLVMAGNKSVTEFVTGMMMRVSDAVEEIMAQSRDSLSEGLADYMNGMVDPAGDGPLRPFTARDFEDFAEGLSSFADLEEPPTDRDLDDLQLFLQGEWNGLFPISFKLTTPPTPVSVQKLTSQADLPTKLPSIKSMYRGEGSFEDYADLLADFIHEAASAVVVTITHMVQGTPSPVPGPPITANVM